MSEAQAAQTAATANGVALLSADSIAIMALSLRRLGRRDEAEKRRDQALAAYRHLGAVTLEERLVREWEAAGAAEPRSNQ